MKKKDLIFYAGTAVLLAFSTQQVKADEQHASDQTPENTSAIVATTTSSEAQNTVSEGVGVEKGIQTENTVATEAAPVTPTVGNNPSFDKGTSDKVVSEQPAPAVVASRAPYGARARVVAARNESVPQQESPVSADNRHMIWLYLGLLSNTTQQGTVRHRLFCIIKCFNQCTVLTHHEIRTFLLPVFVRRGKLFQQGFVNLKQF